MSLRKKLLLLVTLSIAISVGTVAWLLEARTGEQFRQVEQERTATLVAQFRHEFDREGDEITRGVEAIAASESMLQMGLELSSGIDAGGYVNFAQSYASARHLDFLDLFTPDGAIISSAHWPARNRVTALTTASLRKVGWVLYSQRRSLVFGLGPGGVNLRTA